MEESLEIIHLFKNKTKTLKPEPMMCHSGAKRLILISKTRNNSVLL